MGRTSILVVPIVLSIDEIAEDPSVTDVAESEGGSAKMTTCVYMQSGDS